MIDNSLCPSVNLPLLGTLITTMFGLLYSAKNMKCFKNAKDKRCLKLKKELRT